MKSLLLSLLILVSGTVTVVPSSLLAEESDNGDLTLRIGDANNSSSSLHEVAIGKRLKIILDNSGSIGDSWHLDSDRFSQQSVFALTSSVDGSEELPQGPGPHYPGAPEPHAWIFTPTSVNITTIYFYKTDRNGLKSDFLEFDVTVTPTKPTEIISLSSRMSPL
jgi:hypothetical protein